MKTKTKAGSNESPGSKKIKETENKDQVVKKKNDDVKKSFERGQGNNDNYDTPANEKYPHR